MALKKLFCLLIMVVAIVYLSQDKKLSVGKLEATNLHVPTPEFFFLDTTCGIPLTEFASGKQVSTSPFVCILFGLE